MRSKMLGLMLLSLLLLLTLLPACTTSASVVTEDDQAAIYAAIVRQVYIVDNTCGDRRFSVIYLPRATDDRAGDPRETEARSSVLAESVQEAIVAALDDLPTDFIWVDGRDEVPMDRGGVEGNGAIITLGNIRLQEDGSVLVAASIYFADLGGGGMTYIVERVDGIWQITGNTGPRWIS